MAQGKFAAQVGAWVAKTKARQEAVFKESAQRVIVVMQTPVAKGGNLPVDTGFLRASLMATIGPPTASTTPNPGGEGKHSYDAGAVSLVIANASITDTITVVYTANYARFQEYGAHGKPGRRFVALAAQQWQAIVAEVAREAQARAGG